jgi:hypothetical protein
MSIWYWMERRGGVRRIKNDALVAMVHLTEHFATRIKHANASIVN